MEQNGPNICTCLVSVDLMALPKKQARKTTVECTWSPDDDPLNPWHIFAISVNLQTTPKPRILSTASPEIDCGGLLAVKAPLQEGAGGREEGNGDSASRAPSELRRLFRRRTNAMAEGRCTVKSGPRRAFVSYCV